MCNALDTYDSYRIAHLVYELGVLHDEKERVRTEDERRRVAIECQRISVQLMRIEEALERRVYKFTRGFFDN